MKRTAANPASVTLIDRKGRRVKAQIPVKYRKTVRIIVRGDKLSLSTGKRRRSNPGEKLYSSLAQIRSANKRAGYHFFSKDTLRFFDSKVHPGLYGGRYFITSEQFHGSTGSGPRLYTIRAAGPDGDISTVGKFQQYSSLDEARRAARRL